MGTVIPATENLSLGKVFQENQLEALNKDGHQQWHRVVLYDFNEGQQYEGVIHKYETWSEPPPEEPFPRGVRGQGDFEKNRERAARRAKKKIRHACITAQFDRMITLTTRQPIFDRETFQKMTEKFIRLVRKATGDDMPYVLGLEKHDSEKTCEAKRGSLHAHIGVRGRQNYKLLQSIWNYRICGGQGFVRVSNGTRKVNPRRIAGYLSKYIGKSTTEAEFNKKSYWISHKISPPAKTVMLFSSFHDAIHWLIEYFDAHKAKWGFEKGRCWQDTSLGVLWLLAG